MAKVILEAYDDPIRDLPEVCMRCGEPATLTRSRTFSWHPQWVGILILIGLLPYVIVALVLTKRSRVEIPLCDRHKNHWRNRLLFLLVCPLLILGVCIPLSIVLDQPGGNAIGIIWLSGGLAAIFWLIGAAIMESLAIRPLEITETTTTLSGVSEQFVDTYEEELMALENERDEALRERWNDRPRTRSNTIRRPNDDRPETFRARER